MANKSMTDLEVEIEIARLRSSEAVKLAKKAEAIANRRRQYMYCLRVYERRGKELMANGVTMESLTEECEGYGEET